MLNWSDAGADANKTQLYNTMRANECINTEHTVAI